MKLGNPYGEKAVIALWLPFNCGFQTGGPLVANQLVQMHERMLL